MLDDFDFNLNEGLNYFKKGQYQVAIQRFQDAIKLNPKSPEAHYYLGRCYYETRWKSSEIREKHLTLAIQLFQNALILNPNFFEAHVFKAESLFEYGKFDDAIIALQESIKKYPNNPEFYTLLSKCYNAKWDFENSIQALKSALSLDPNNVENNISIGQLYFSQKKFVDGKKFFINASKLNPDNVVVYKKIVYSFKKYDLFDRDCEILFKKIIKLSPEPNNYLDYYHFLKKQGKNKEAINLIKIALIKFPENLDLQKEQQYFILNKIFTLCKQDKFDRALREYQKIFSNFEYLTIGISLDKLDELFRVENRLEEEIRFFLILLNEYPDIEENRRVLYNIFERENLDLYKLIKYINALSSEDLYAEDRIEFATYLYFHGGGKFNDSVIDEFQRAAELDPQNDVVHLQLAGLFYVDEKYDNSLKEFRDVIKSLRDIKRIQNYIPDEEYYYYFVDGLLRKRQFEEAERYLFEIVELAPDGFNDYASWLLSHFTNNGIYDGAEKVYQKIIKIFEKWKGTKASFPVQDESEYVQLLESVNDCLSEAHFGLGCIYFRKAMSNPAINELKKSIEYNQERKNKPYKLLARIYFEKNLFSEAIEISKKAIDINPKDVEIRKLYIDILKKQNGDKDEIDKQMQGLIEIDPKKSSIEKYKKNIEEKSQDYNTSLLIEFEINIRKLIHEVLDPKYQDFWQVLKERDNSNRPVPNKIEERIEREIIKNPFLKRSEFERLEYCDILDYPKIIIKFWADFDPIFGNKENMNVHFNNINGLRNPEAHVRNPIDVQISLGKASIQWFDKIFKAQGIQKR